MEIHTVLVTANFQGNHWQRLKAALAPAHIIRVDGRDAAELEAAISQADVAIVRGDLDSRYLNRERLRWVHCDHAGIEKSACPEVQDGEIAGVGLDTFGREPLPTSSPLWDAPNVLITPHATPQVPDRTGATLDILCENIRRYRADEPLVNLLQPEDVYTKGARNVE